ncbi:MAG: hypothetical protein WCD65_16970 [Pseudolabrys sp.]
MAPQTYSGGHGTWQDHNDVNLYGHLFESVEADREDMKKLEAAVRAA